MIKSKTLPAFLIRAVLMISCWLSFSIIALPQDNNALWDEAALYSSNSDYEMAIPIYTLLIDKTPLEPELYIERGNAYSFTKKYNEAIHDYKIALSLTPDDTELIYKLANSYDIINDLANAVSLFRLLNQKDPHNATPFHRLAILYLSIDSKVDSALYFAEKGLEIDPENPISFYALSMVYLQKSEYARAIDAAKKGLIYDENNIHLNSSLGLANFFLKDFSESYRYFSEAAKFESRTDVTYYMALTKLISNTRPEDYYFDENNKIHFNPGILQDHKRFAKKSNEKYTARSFEHMKNILADSLFFMGLKDFYSVYSSYASDDSYLPVSMREDSLQFFLKNNYYEKFEEEALQALQNNPVNFPIYYLLSEFYDKKSQKEKYYNAIFKYYGFLNAILASGDGSDAENAYYVNDREHEFEITASLGLSVVSQKTIVKKNIHFDVLSINDKSGNISELYFNIEDIYVGINNLRIKRKAQLKDNSKQE